MRSPRCTMNQNVNVTISGGCRSKELKMLMRQVDQTINQQRFVKHFLPILLIKETNTLFIAGFNMKPKSADNRIHKSAPE